MDKYHIINANILLSSQVINIILNIKYPKIPNIGAIATNILINALNLLSISLIIIGKLYRWSGRLSLRWK